MSENGIVMRDAGVIAREINFIKERPQTADAGVVVDGDRRPALRGKGAASATASGKNGFAKMWTIRSPRRTI